MKAKKRVLILEDDHDLRPLIVNKIESAFPNMECFEADSPKSAMKHFKDNKFDYIVSDYNMPGQTALEMMKALRAINQNCGIIIFSGYVDQQKLRDVYALGAFDCIEKSEGMDRVLESIRKMDSFTHRFQINDEYCPLISNHSLLLLEQKAKQMHTTIDELIVSLLRSA